MSKKKITIADLKAMKANKDKFAMMTVYDYPMAQLVEKSNIEMILLGDSLGMVIQGLDSTTPVNMDDMLYHLKLVRRGAPNTFIVGDMSFMSYQACPKEAIHNAGLLMKAGADCVKIEGNKWQADKIEAVVRAGIPVMGHIGLTPQTAAALGGFKLQGKDNDSAQNIIDDALAYEKAGAFLILMECLPLSLGTKIDEMLKVPTISTGAGPAGTGFNINAYDMLGMFGAFVPKFVKQYRQLGQDIVAAFNEWNTDVKEKKFPGPEHCFKG